MKHVQEYHKKDPSFSKVRLNRMDTDIIVLAYMQLAAEMAGDGVPAPRILALGCGDLSEWETLRILTRRRDFDITVIDYDQANLDALKRFIPDFRITTFKKNIAEIMRDNQFKCKFDLIYTNDIIEKIDDVFAIPFIKSVFNLLSIGGSFIASNKMPEHDDHHQNTDLNWPSILRSETAFNQLARMAVPQASTRTHIDTNRKKTFLEMQNG